MAATALSLAETVVGGALKKLGSIAIDELAKTLGVRKDVWYIIEELDMMQSFLMVAEDRRDDNIILKTWTRQVKDLAYQIEDCIADFQFHLENRGFFYKLWTWKTRHQIASTIRDIRAKVQEVSMRNLRYNLIKPLDSNIDITYKRVNTATRAIGLTLEESELVGQSIPIKELIELLAITNEQKKVIWIIGMGGLGKSTIAKKVYDICKTMNHFTTCVWVVVSQRFDVRDLLMRILKQISSDIREENITLEELMECVKTKLANKTYLVVLDDVWTLQAWNNLKNVFPNNNKGGRIIITTRNESATEACNSNHKTYILKPLTDDDSRDLLLRKINKNDDSFLEHKGLKDVFEKIIKKCQGLPLALVTIGSLLASKPKNKDEWENLLNRLGSELETNTNTEALQQILELSYNDLPYHLKPCLLYLSIFPEDYEIKRSVLVCRWMAEGFVRERRGMTPEKVAEEYFFELINRSMIQPSKIGLDGRVKSCRVHDIMRELILAMSIDENLVFINSDQENMTITDKFRHLVITDSKKFEENQSSIRSISIFGGSIPSLLFSSSSKSKFLRTLSLENLSEKKGRTAFQYVEHKHLKYMSITDKYLWTSISGLRKSIQNYRNLQTLQLRISLQSTDSAKWNVTKLHKLRHLGIGIEYLGIKLDKGIRNLKELQSLKSIDIGRSHSKVVQELAELSQLKKLCVRNLKRKQFKKFSASLSKLSCLRSLSIHVELRAVGFLDGASLSSSPPVHLKRIRLDAWIEKLPAWISKLDNLTKITLERSRLEEDAMVVLQKLPNLMVLRLRWDAYVNAKLIFESNTFLDLRVLGVFHLSKLDQVVFQAGSLPRFETLEIDFHCDLKSGINGIEFLPRLKKITLGDIVYVANLDVVLKQVGEHPNRPALQVKDPKYQERKEAEYRREQREAEEAGPSHVVQE